MPVVENDESYGKIEASAQMKFFLNLTFKLSDDAPKNIRPSQEGRTGFALVLRVLVDEFDRVMRKDSEL